MKHRRLTDSKNKHDVPKLSTLFSDLLMEHIRYHHAKLISKRVIEKITFLNFEMVK